MIRLSNDLWLNEDAFQDRDALKCIINYMHTRIEEKYDDRRIPREVITDQVWGHRFLWEADTRSP